MLWLAKDERGPMLFHGPMPHKIEGLWMGHWNPIGRLPEDEIQDLLDKADPTKIPIAIEICRSRK